MSLQDQVVSIVKVTDTVARMKLAEIVWVYVRLEVNVSRKAVVNFIVLLEIKRRKRLRRVTSG